MRRRGSNIDEWRSFFESAKVDVFEVIENGIMVAAMDCPEEFKLRRDEIAEILFSCRLRRCGACEHVELSVSADGENKDGEVHGDSIKSNSTDINKVNSSTNDINHGNGVDSFCSYDEAEALTDELEEESRIVNEVLRIKEIVDNFHEESVDSLFESLRRLELMGLSASILEATEIGKAVNNLKKHRSPQINQLARRLVDGWKALFKEYYTVRLAAKGESDSPDSVNPPPVPEEEEEGLPSPPLEDFGAILNVHTTSLELSKFFDGMDDDGNARNHGEFDKTRENVRKSMPLKGNMGNENKSTERRRPQSGSAETVLTKDKNRYQIVKEDTVIKQSKPSNAPPEPRRPSMLGSEQRVNCENADKIHKRPVQQEKSKGPGEALDQKLAASKRKLHENYQQAINAKKQRTVQVMELSDIPKNGLSRNAHMKPGSHNRQRPNVRR